VEAWTPCKAWRKTIFITNNWFIFTYRFLGPLDSLKKKAQTLTNFRFHLLQQCLSRHTIIVAPKEFLPLFSTKQRWQAPASSGAAVADGDGRTRACGEMQGLSCVRKNQKSMSEQQIASPEQGRLHSLIM
jgi:hypothetical protein